jgi:hypothetical protein
MRTETEFLKYVREFYGTKGLYAEFFATNPPQASDYRAAYRTLLALRKKAGIEFEGDSFDREHLRDILFVRMGILTPEQTEYQVEV